MAWARLVTYPGGSEAQYAAVVEALGPAHSDAPGRTFLAAGASERGWQIFMVWDSKDAFQQWAGQHTGPAHERAGERGWQSPPEVLDFDVVQTLD